MKENWLVFLPSTTAFLFEKGIILSKIEKKALFPHSSGGNNEIQGE
jgi:hypothetical protein